eukprot:14482511-Alexandrium_andersonii.AAC.1
MAYWTPVGSASLARKARSRRSASRLSCASASAWTSEAARRSSEAWVVASQPHSARMGCGRP